MSRITLAFDSTFSAKEDLPISMPSSSPVATYTTATPPPPPPPPPQLTVVLKLSRCEGPLKEQWISFQPPASWNPFSPLQVIPEAGTKNSEQTRCISDNAHPAYVIGIKNRVMRRVRVTGVLYPNLAIVLDHIHGSIHSRSEVQDEHHPIPAA